MNKQFTRVVLFLVALCAFVAGTLYFTQSHVHRQSPMPVDIAMHYMHDLQGIVTGVTYHSDGMQVLLQNEQDSYTIALNGKQAQVYGRYNQIEPGSGLRVSGPVIPGIEPSLVVAETVTVLGVDVDYVNNLRGTIIAIEQGKDGINATIETADGSQVTSTISYVTTQVIYTGDISDIRVGTPVTLTGTLIDLGHPHIAADIAVVQPVINYTDAMAVQPVVVQ